MPGAEDEERTYDDPSPNQLEGESVELADGRIVAAGFRGDPSFYRNLGDPCGEDPPIATAEIFDPSEGEEGSWTRGADGPCEMTGIHSVALITGTEASCGDRCGMILVHASAINQEEDTPPVVLTYFLYNPTTDAWAKPADSARDLSVNPGGETQLALIEGTNCGDNCGKVLAAGGTDAQYDFGDDRRYKTSELYDPATDSWERIEDLPDTPLTGGKGTTLPDGRVLWVRNDGAELFDPVTKEWTTVASPEYDHGNYRDHTATPLDDGRVLVAGTKQGGSDPDPAGAAEMYDPAGDSWAAVGTCEACTNRHRAVRLASGDVLFVDNDYLPVSLYDVAENAWSVGPPPPAAFDPIGRTILAQRVTGGDGGPCGSNCDKVLVAGGGKENDQAAWFDESAPFPAATVTDVSPAVSPTSGGRAVDITGTNFYGEESFGDVTVRFGDQPAARVVWESPLQMTAVAPPAEQGVVDVTVVNGSGQASEAGEPSRLTYELAHGGAWRGTGALDECEGEACQGRYGHTATRLDGPACRSDAAPEWCGKVLVAGGTDSLLLSFWIDVGSPIASALLYDPASGQWEPTGSLTAARFNHTATLLDGPNCGQHCGKVLVVGGAGEDGEAVGGAELYNPETGGWTDAGTATARFGHTATLLEGEDCGQRCGQVLVAGGTDDLEWRPPFESVEFFDPSSGAWETGPALTTCESSSCEARGDHTATLLGDGTVLVAGGYSGSAPMATSQVFDPAADAWRPAPDLRVPRVGHAATRLAGENCGDLCGTVLVTGRAVAHPEDPDAWVFNNRAEVFDPTANNGAGEWRFVASMKAPRAGHTTTQLEDGSVLVAGGGMFWFDQVDDYRSIRTAERFDPTTGEWSWTNSLAEPRGVATATELDGPACEASSTPAYCGGVLMAGGAGWGNSPAPPTVASAEVFGLAPLVTDVEPAEGPAEGGTEVTITGQRFHEVTEVAFGGTPAESFEVVSPTELTAVTPAHESGSAPVTVTTAGGGSSEGPSAREVAFEFLGAPDHIADLDATALSTSEIQLSFTAPADGLGGLASRFVVAQSLEPITDEEAFEAAHKLCDGECVVAPAATVDITVVDLTPDTQYHYAVKAVNDADRVGPLSNPASARTLAADDGGTGGAGTEDGDAAADDDGAVAEDDGTTATDDDAAGDDVAAQTSVACPEGEVPTAAFADREEIPEAHRFNVDCAAWRDIVAGFEDGTYRPVLPVRRDQMATFIAGMLEAAGVDLPQPDQERFVDVPDDSAHDEAVHQLAAAGIVRGGALGLDADSYGPGLRVRRDQMASFLVRAAEFATGEDLASQTQAFEDVSEGNAHFATVNGAAEAGYAQGFGDGTYRPGSDVRRDQMASFVVRVLDDLYQGDSASAG